MWLGRNWNVRGSLLLALVVGATISAAPDRRASFGSAATGPRTSVQKAGRVQYWRLLPRTKTVALPVGKAIVAIAAGYGHSLALTRGGRVYAWGANAAGQLGTACTSTVRCLTPLLVEGLPVGDAVTAIAAGYQHSLVATRSGRVYAWGADSSGQLGAASSGSGQPIMVVGLPVNDPVTTVAAGYVHSVALTRSGRVYAWGANRFGEGGQNSATIVPLPSLVRGLPKGDPVVAIAAGAAHTLALTRSGHVYAWGDQGTGQMGVITTGARGVPVMVSDMLSGDGVGAVAAGSVDSFAASRGGTVYAWGDNGFGQLGRLDVGYLSSTPVMVEGLSRGDGVTSLAAGDYFSLALTRSGHVYAWGRNDDGQLGDGNNVDAGTAVALDGRLFGDRVVAVAAGGAHSLAVTANGHVYAWGKNDDGQLGTGTITSSYAPRRVY